MNDNKTFSSTGDTLIACDSIYGVDRILKEENVNYSVRLENVKYTAVGYSGWPIQYRTGFYYFFVDGKEVAHFIDGMRSLCILKTPRVWDPKLIRDLDNREKIN